MKRSVLLAAGLATVMAMQAPATAQQNFVNFVFRGKPSQFQDFGYLVRGAAWRFEPEEERVIFVCWENPGPSNEESRGWVRDQIEKTWQRHTALEFRGWQRCADVNAGVRILVSDEGPRVKRFGRHLDGVKGGMILNDAFKNWSPECQSEREFCIRAIAVHEFGHALGFAHEQNRPDTPGECAMVHGQGQTKEIPLTPYDPESVMNYCHPYRVDLSELDIKAAQRIYGRP